MNLPEGDYLIAFTHLEGGGGSRMEFRFKSPTMASETTVKPSDPAQAGYWGAPFFNVGTISNDIRVANNSTIDLGDTGGVTVTGGTFQADATTLTVRGQDAAFTLTGGTHNLPAGLQVITESDARFALDQPSTAPVDLTVASGVLTVSDPAALGSGAGQVTVADGGQLQLAGEITLSDSVTLRGAGPDGVGALANLSGMNHVTGAVTIAASTAIGSYAGTLIVDSDLDLRRNTLTVAGAGDTVLSGQLSGAGGDDLFTNRAFAQPGRLLVVRR